MVPTFHPAGETLGYFQTLCRMFTGRLLEIRFDTKVEIRRGIQLRTHAGSEKIEVAAEIVACACGDFKRFDAGIACLRTGSVLVVLHDGVVQLQFPQRSYD